MSYAHVINIPSATSDNLIELSNKCQVKKYIQNKLVDEIHFEISPCMKPDLKGHTFLTNSYAFCSQGNVSPAM